MWLKIATNNFSQKYCYKSIEFNQELKIILIIWLITKEDQSDYHI